MPARQTGDEDKGLLAHSATTGDYQATAAAAAAAPHHNHILDPEHLVPLSKDELGFAPAHLRSSRQRWLWLGIVCCACALASGPVGAWPTLEPLFIKAGIFSGPNQKVSLDGIYSLSMACQLGGSLPAGLLYDKFGGRNCALWGGLGAAVGLFFMAVACWHPVSFSWLMFVGYPLAQFAGQINTYGIFVFIWLIPDHQNLVSSAAGGVQCISDMLALVAVGLSSCCGFFVGSFLFTIAILSAVAGCACYMVVPDKHTMLQFAAVALDDGEHGDVLQEHEGEATCCGKGSNVERSVGVMRHHSMANALLLLFSIAYCLSIIFPVQQMLFYYHTLFPKNSPLPTQLVDIWAVMYGIGGFVCALFGGALCDKLGLRNFVIIVSMCSGLVALMLPFPTFAMQVGAQVGMTVGLSLYIIIVNRFAMLYASPDLFGTFSGVQFTVISIAMLACIQTISISISQMEHGPLKYQIPYVGLGVSALILGLVLAAYWHRQPPPAVGSVWTEEKELRKREAERQETVL